MKSDRQLAILLVVPSIAVLLFVVIFPMIYSIYISTTSFDFVHKELTKFVYLGNYVSALSDPDFIASLRITAIYVSVAVTVEFLLGLGIGLLFLEPFKGRRTMMTLLLFPMMITPVVASYMFRLLYNVQTGPLDYMLLLLGVKGVPPEWFSAAPTALPSVLIIDIWQWTPFMAFVLLAGMLALPREPIEAAEVDGASSWQKFRAITFPMLRPIVAIAVLLRTIDASKVFDYIFVVTYGGPGNATATASFYSYLEGFAYFQMGYAAALSYILLIIVSIVTTYIGRRLFV
jgi:multiple sugar transport system permease protein